MSKYFFIFTSAFTLLISCQKVDIASGDQNYSKGTFIVNEGPFQNGTGTITFINGKDTLQDIFGKENHGAALGNIAQSMIKFDNKYFIAINNGAKIQVVDAGSFKSITEIKGIDVPRYFASSNDKLYVSAWGKDFSSGSVYEIDSKTNTITNQINTGGAPEKMLIKGNKLYVTMSSSNKLIIIDISSNKIIDNLTVGDAPVGIASDKSGTIWVVCWGFTDYNVPTNNTLGSLYRLENDQIKNYFILPNGANSLETGNAGDRLFFLINGKLYTHAIDDTKFEERVMYDGYYNGLGYQKSNDRIFLADAIDYQSLGKAFIISTSGKLEAKFTTGIIPGFFYFSE